MKGSIFRRTMSIVLVISAFLCLTISANAYSGSDAISYANTYAKSRNSAYRSADSDCANFVSQCLYAGGLPMDSNWYYYGYFNYSSSWFGADSLKNYLKNDYGATRLVSMWTKYGQGNSYAYINNSGNLQGNGKEVVFYDWKGDGLMDHASFCVGTGYDQEQPITTHLQHYGDLINQHTTDRKQTIWHLDFFNNFRDISELYAFEV